MLYLSQLLGALVTDQHDVRLGKIIDVLTLASQVGRNEATYPTVILVAGEEDQYWRVPCSAIEKHGHTWRLHSPSEQFVIPPQLQEDVIPKGHTVNRVPTEGNPQRGHGELRLSPSDLSPSVGAQFIAPVYWGEVSLAHEVVDKQVIDL